MEGYTIYFNPFDLAPELRKEVKSAIDQFVQFRGNQKPSMQQVKDAFKQAFGCDLSGVSDSCFVWRGDADPRIRLKFMYEYKDIVGEWESTSDIAYYKEKEYHALLTGGKESITSHIEGLLAKIYDGKFIPVRNAVMVKLPDFGKVSICAVMA